MCSTGGSDGILNTGLFELEDLDEFGTCAATGVGCLHMEAEKIAVMDGDIFRSGASATGDLDLCIIPLWSSIAEFVVLRGFGLS